MRHPAACGPASRSMVRSLNTGLVVMVLLGVAVSLLVAVTSPLYSGPAIAALVAANAVVVAAGVRVIGRDTARAHPLALLGWQALCGITVAVSAWRELGHDHVFPSQQVVVSAAAVTAVHGTPVGHAGVCLLIASSGWVGGRVAGGDAVFAGVLFPVVFYVFMLAVSRIMLRGAREADRTLEHLARVERASAVAAARVDRLRDLHDTVLATLTAVARGIAVDRDLLRERCADDLGRLGLTLDRVIRDAAMLGLHVRVRHVGEPAPLPAALLAAMSEALTNVGKHAGVHEAELTITWEPETIRAVIGDNGRGFDTGAATPGLGLRESVLGRISEAGGRAAVTSSPGAGTAVEIMLRR